MKFYHSRRFPKIVIDGHLTDTLKISEDFKYTTHGDTLRLYSVRVKWHHDTSPYRHVLTIYSEFDDANGYQVDLCDFYRETDLNTRNDIYVFDIKGNQLEHYIYNGLWIKTPLQKGENLVFIYYGSGTENTGNPNNVFELYEHNIGTNSYVSQKTFRCNIQLTVKANVQQDESMFIGLTDSNNSTSIGYQYDASVGFVAFVKYMNTYVRSESLSLNTEQQYEFTIQLTESQAKFYVNGNHVFTHYVNVESDLHVKCNAVNVDYLYVSKYREPEPTVVNALRQTK